MKNKIICLFKGHDWFTEIMGKPVVHGAKCQRCDYMNEELILKTLVMWRMHEVTKCEEPL